MSSASNNLQTFDLSQDPYTIFKYDDFISINSGGGSIGRFHWVNRSSGYIEFIDDSGLPFDRSYFDLPGEVAFIWTVGDWFAWLLS